MNHDCSVESAAGATLVTVRVRNDAPVARRVRVRNRLDGPVCPPRREGVPESGWDEEGYEGVVPAEGSVAVGYACPVETDEHDDSAPVAVESLGRADDADESGDSVADAVRSLGRARPPADAVPGPDDDATAGRYEDGGDADDVDDAADETPESESKFAPEDIDARCSSDGDIETAPGGDAERGTDDPATESAATPRSPSAAAAAAATGLPTPVASWLAEVRTRVARAERLSDASAAEAAEVLEESGGYEGVSSLPDRVATDEEALRAFAASAERLADRAADADAEPVVESVGRVA
ncbi:DUF7857 domain-containing protein [Halopelagius longus]|uniref:DUF8080 domain-containing protein n=1 Tax=Halopelagius longus TaxID=1236180 RepID=A0A1H1E7Y5_9EURY|nr:hypothetical protein [Halopelagius longus]RDI71645.1 hypothetical protein DWB78_07855 [Halopelagius longus]SDQ84855.1 hypothetical protein SAMN05216278_2779 [Halopelagius longus]